MTVVDMGDLVVRNRTSFRSESGQFLSKVESGSAAAMLELAQHIAAKAVGIASSRLKIRTGDLVGSIDARMVGGTAAEAYADSGHAAVQEKGGVAHDIPNSFGWGPEYGLGGKFGGFFHPGNKGFHFLAEAGKGSAALGLAILRRNLPG